MPRDYLEPDRGRASDLLVAGVMATMFFTPLGGKLISGAFRGAKRGAKFAGRNIARGGRALGRAVSRVNYGEVAWGARTAALRAYGGTQAIARGGAEAAEFIGRNRRFIAPTVMAGAVVGGTAAAMGQRSPRGPESYTSFEGGMPADNLGATGDLTLALHHRR